MPYISRFPMVNSLVQLVPSPRAYARLRTTGGRHWSTTNFLKDIPDSSHYEQFI